MGQSAGGGEHDAEAEMRSAWERRRTDLWDMLWLSHPPGSGGQPRWYSCFAFAVSASFAGPGSLVLGLATEDVEAFVVAAVFKFLAICAFVVGRRFRRADLNRLPPQRTLPVTARRKRRR
jgi:hypothetical protein